MAATKEQKKLFGQKILPYKDRIEELDSELKKLDAMARKNTGIRDYIEIKKASVVVQKCNVLVAMARLSSEIQNLKNDTHLNDARKLLSNSVNALNKIVGEHIDTSLTESSEGALKLNKLTPDIKFRLFSAIKNTAVEISDELGQNHKWRWSFPDLHYKITIFGRNLFDFKEFDRIKDPNETFYRIRQEYLQMIVDEAHFTAQEFRSRFELSTKDVSDLFAIRRVLECMKQIFVLTGNQTELQKTQTAIDANEEKIESLGKKKSK